MQVAHHPQGKEIGEGTMHVEAPVPPTEPRVAEEGVVLVSGERDNGGDHGGGRSEDRPPAIEGSPEVRGSYAGGERRHGGAHPAGTDDGEHSRGDASGVGCIHHWRGSCNCRQQRK